MASFTWLCDQDPPRETTVRVNRVQFGDGYMQRVGDGINTILEKWDVAFTLRTLTEINAIEAFLVARAGVESFDWTTPTGATKKFICGSWSTSYSHAGSNSLTATFEQVIE